MNRTLAACLLVSLVAGATSAEDAEDRLHEAVAKLADDDPDVRDQGRDLLGALAGEHPDLVRSVTRNPDAEVAATAREVFFERCIPREQVEQGRFGEILAAIADPEHDTRARRALFVRFLALGPKAAEALANEMKETTARSTTAAVTLAPGQWREIKLTMRNTGGRALWFTPAAYSVYQCQPHSFGEMSRPGERILGVRGGGSTVQAEERVLGSLSFLRRIPPGGDILLATATVQASCCCLCELRVRGGGTSGLKAAFNGVDVPALPPALEDLPNEVIPFLSPRESKSFKATLLPKGSGGRPALCVTATQEIETSGWDYGNRFWWVSTDAQGHYLDSGPMRDELTRREEWKESQEKTVEMSRDPPPGTRHLWLGFECEGDGEQAVPPPLEFPGAGAELK